MNHEGEARRLGNQSDRLRTALLLRGSGRYELAATEFQAAKDYASAASCFEQAGDYEQAAINYLRAGDHAQAGNAYRVAGNPVRAARMYERAGNFAFASQLFREAGEYGNAARCYQHLGQASAAGEMYERAGQPLAAAECFFDARLYSRAARGFEEAAAWARAADAWTQAGDRPRAAAASRRVTDRAPAVKPAPPASGTPGSGLALLREATSRDRDATRALFTQLAHRGYLTAADERTIERFERSPITPEALPVFLVLVSVYRSCGLDDRCRRLCDLIREEAAGTPDLERAIAEASVPGTRLPTPPPVPRAALRHEPARRPTPSFAAVAGDAPPEAPLTVSEIREGELFDGRYRVLRKLGAGAIGAVFMARDERLDETVALKVLKPMKDVGDDVVGRFKQEIKITRRIVHPGVVRTYDFGECGSLPYLSMEYVDGSDLRSALREVGRFSVRDGVRIVRAVCAALEAAHRLDVVHRDIKPENILLDSQGQVKLIDFGIAKFKDAVSAALTETSIGTPEYLSPEMALGHPVDRHTDIYSVGVVMYEIFCGTTPFRGGSLVNLLTRQVIETPRAPRELVPELPLELEATILRALEKEPEHRQDTTAEVAAELALLEG